MTSIVSASQLVSGQVQTLDSVRAHALPSDAMILASSSLVTPTNQNTGSYAMVESANASITLTTTGSVPAVTQSPFADLYKEGSIYFSGTTGNYITTTASGLISSPWGTVGMTIEAWVYYNTFTGASVVAGGTPTALQCPTLFGFQQATGAGSALGFGSNVNGYVTFFYNCNGPVQSVTAQTQLAANTWNHIAMTCSTSGQIFLFVNGVQSQIVANRNGTLQAAAYYETVQSGGGIASGIQPAFGQFNSVACNAYMADFRIIAGAPVYTGSTSSYATFTVPPAPLTIAATGTTHMLVRAGQNSPTIQNGALKFDRGLKQYMNFGPQTFNVATKGFSAIFKFTLTGVISNYERLWQMSDGTRTFGFLRAGTSTSWYSFYVGADGETATQPFTIPPNTTSIVAVNYNPSVGTNGTWSTWLNGSRKSSVAMGARIPIDVVSPLSKIGDIAETNTFTANAFAFYNRSLSDAELYQSYLALSTPAPLKTLEIGDINGTPALSIAGDGRVSIQAIGQTSAVTQWPPAAMTGYDTVINGGMYKARASTELGASNLTWYSFNKDGFSTYWTSQNSVYSTSLPYGYTGTYTTTDANGSVYPGEWVQVQLASSIVLSSYSVTSGGFPSTRSPGKFVLLGSRDGNNWFLVDSRSGATYTSPYVNTYTIATGQGFSYYRIVISQTCGSAGVAELGELIIYGTADTSPALTIAPATVFNTSVATPSLTGVVNTSVFTPQDFSSSGLNIPAYVVSNTATTANTVQYSSMGPFAGEGSLYFQKGTGSGISFPSSVQSLNYNIFTSDFTLEFWFYNTIAVNGTQVLVSRGSVYTTSDWCIYIQSNGLLYFTYNSITGYLTSATVPTVNAWNHLAVCLKGSTLYLLVNGNPNLFGGGTSAALSTTVYSSGFPVNINGPNLSTQMQGYITNFRLIRGQALYTTTFTPPTQSLQPIQGTTQAGLPYGTVLLLRNAPAPGRIQTTKFSGANSGSVLSFPPAAMTGYSTALNAGYGQGTYVASSSGFNGTEYPWRAFDKNSANTQWETSPAYAGSPPYGVTTGVTTTDVNGTAYTGEWIQIQMPSSMVISNYQMRGSYYADIQSPGKWWILGSRDGASWFLVDSRTGITAGTSRGTYIISSSQAFTYYRFVVNQLQGAGVYGHMTEWILNGTIESVNITPDGRVGLGVVNPTRALEVAGDIVCSGTVSGGNPVMFRNAIINGYFDIWQRGVSFSNPATATYTVDRFQQAYDGTGSTRTITRGTFSAGQIDVPNNPKYFFRHAQTAAGTGGTYNNICIQHIEGVQTFAGQVITLSLWAKASVGTPFINPALRQNFGTSGSSAVDIGTSFTPVLGTTWKYYTWQIAVPSITGKTIGTAGDSLSLFIYTNFNTVLTLDLAAIQVEQGTVATPFEVRPYATELALCQRYYTRFDSAGAATNYMRFGAGVCDSGTGAYTMLHLPVVMRAVPAFPGNTTSNSAPSTFTINIGGSNFAVTSMVSSDRTQSVVGVNWTGTGGVARAGALAIANNTTTAFLAFDAEL